MKLKNILKFVFWVGLISALVIILVLIPSLEYYTFSILIILAIFGLKKVQERFWVRKKESVDQITNASLGKQ
ncbi:hypothetical protein DSAG12_00488 [Promethearchaeum syntrophicum]|uniref:Uncharacterized protein n=1 Tax=Promethearchaeum syntrophicum TaxID=2594042 RepID=A0A5B9D6N7_9ARCH|nr:hypothetical protein [Candidatus Prometheoarchaeum syntrophicum]QEE14675.1 hypothetical protein DSAG12_00488 [Candidatus Prometheoarchaeum syntrophicum]